MLDFIKEVLDDYVEVHESYYQTMPTGQRVLIVKIDLADGEGIKQFTIVAHE